MEHTEILFDAISKRLLTGDTLLVSSRQVTLHGIPGRELKYEDKGETLSAVRIYFLGNETYIVFCAMPKKAFCERHINEFLESFDLQQK